MESQTRASMSVGVTPEKGVRDVLALAEAEPERFSGVHVYRWWLTYAIDARRE
jgi:hypothetical protein